MTPPQADLAIPTLPARDMPATLDFYRQLGFDAEVVSPDGAYAIADRGSLELHFFAHPLLQPEQSAFGAYLRVQDVDALYLAWAEVGLPTQGIPRLMPLEDKPWGMREFALIDLDGSLLRVGQEI